MTEGSSHRRGRLNDDFTTFAGRDLVTPPELLDWVGAREVSRVLQINHLLASQLMVSQWAARLLASPSNGRCFRVQGQLMMPRQALDALARVPFADDDVDYLNPRLGPATRPPSDSDDDRFCRGASGLLTEEQLYFAATRNWRVIEPEEWIGRLFVASLSSYVVLAGRVTRIRAAQQQRTAFEVDLTDPEALDRFVGKRIPAYPGTVVLKHRAGHPR